MAHARVAARTGRVRLASRTSSSTCSSRARRPGPPKKSRSRSIRSAARSTPSRRRSTPGYYLKVLDEHLPLAVDILADLITNPTFTDDDIEKEKKVILEEIKMVEDTPDDLVHEIFAEGFWTGHPLGRPILGTPASVSALNRTTLKRLLRPDLCRGELCGGGGRQPSARQRAGACSRRALDGLPHTRPRHRRRGADHGVEHPGPAQGARAEPRRVRHPGAAAASPRTLRRLRVEHHARRVDELAPVPERARKARPGLRGLLGPVGLPGFRRPQHLCRLRQRRRRRADRSRRRRDPADEGRRPRRRSSCGAPRITSRAR